MRNTRKCTAAKEKAIVLKRFVVENVRFTLATLLLYVSCFCMILGADVFVSNRFVRVYTAAGLTTLGSGLSRLLFVDSAQSILDAVGVVGMVKVLGSWRCDSQRHPGHWLLVISGLGASIDVASNLIIGEYFAGDTRSYERACVVALVIGTAVATTGLTMAIRQLWNSTIWRAFFGYCVLIATLPLLHEAASYFMISMPFYHLMLLLAIGQMVFAIAAVWHDNVARELRDTLHWVGVGCLLISDFLAVGTLGG